jgi:hypothetical protein
MEWEENEVIEFLIEHSHEENGCWIWDGPFKKTFNRDGTVRNNKYGFVFFQGKNWLVHRLSWLFFNGDLPPELDHVCRHTLCFNPDHLESVTHSENMLRGDLANRKKTKCPKGHRYIRQNTTVNKGKRYCRICKRLDLQRRRREKGGNKKQSKLRPGRDVQFVGR